MSLGLDGMVIGRQACILIIAYIGYPDLARLWKSNT